MPPEVSKRVSLGNPDFMMLDLGRHRHADQRRRPVSPASSALRPRDPATAIEVLISDTALRRGMLDYSQRILILSLIISFFTALLVFLTPSTG